MTSNKLMRKKKIDFKFDEKSMSIFNNRIEEFRKDCDSYIEAVASYCESIDAEIEDVLPLISSGLKAKMHKEEVARRNVIDDEPTLGLI